MKCVTKRYRPLGISYLYSDCYYADIGFELEITSICTVALFAGALVDKSSFLLTVNLFTVVVIKSIAMRLANTQLTRASSIAKSTTINEPGQRNVTLFENFNDLGAFLCLQTSEKSTCLLIQQLFHEKHI